MNNHNLPSRKDYYEKAQSWDQEIIAGTLASRKRAWQITAASLVITTMALTALILLLPLKTFAPYVVTVDAQTGYLELTKGLVSSALTEDEAITESNLVRYVSMREQYNPLILEENYRTVSLMSSDLALKDYKHLWSSTNPTNPSVTLGKDKSVSIRIKSVSLISDNIASIRFIREMHSAEAITKNHYNAIIGFQYTKKPMRMEDRFENPLGFQVTSYRINPESPETVQ